MAGIGRGKPKVPLQQLQQQPGLTNGISLGRGVAPTSQQNGDSQMSNGISLGRGHVSEQLQTMIDHGRGMPSREEPLMNGYNDNRRDYVPPLGYGRGVGVGRGMVPGAETPIFKANGLANCAGAQKPTFIVPNVGQADGKRQSHENGNESPGRFTDASTEGDSSEGTMSAEDMKKEKRKLQKKIRACELLEEKRAAGGTLDADEASKLQKKNEFIAQLKQLSLDD
jgi:hypothetical protein